MKRRAFVRNSLIAGTACLVAPNLQALGANGALRVAVVGVRGRGRSHIKSLLSAKNVRLVALCDCDEDVLRQRAGELEKGKTATKVRTFGDYRKLCEDPEIDAITIATTNHTHALIAMTAIANGKHVYIEKPISHNVWEGTQLAQAQEKSGLIVAHGFQRRSETSWAEAFEWLRSGEMGKLTLARGFCYKPRKSIGKVPKPLKAPTSVDYDLWLGPRADQPVLRKQFHYDWHWQSQFGNGDLGNQGPHQLDVCRWALGDPMALPATTVSVGGRFGYDDDGDTANTQAVWIEGGIAPILFEVRGLPKKGLNWKEGMDEFRGVSIGNVLEYEGGTLVGGHNPGCTFQDKDGKTVKTFKGSRDHVHEFVKACLTGKQNPLHTAANGHHSAALAHIGNHSLSLGKEVSLAEVEGAFEEGNEFSEALERMKEHLSANGLEGIQVGKGLPVTTNGREFTGALAQQVIEKDREFYREGFELPTV